ncbi:hypothetical protein [Roseibium sp. M-1]
MKSVYITGQMRSGTSLISSYLGQNKGCRILVDQFRIVTASKEVMNDRWSDFEAPLNLIDRMKLFRSFLNVTLWFGRGSEDAKRTALKRIEPFKRYISRVRTMDKSPHIRDGDIVDLPPFSTQLEFYEEMLAHVLDPVEKLGVAVMGNKETRGEEFANARAATGKKSIIIIRDPRATLFSFVEKAQKDQAFKVKNDVEEVIGLWLRSFDEFTATTSALKIRYEDFILEHEKTISQMSDYLGLPLQPNLKPATNNSSYGDVEKGELSGKALYRWRQAGDTDFSEMITERLKSKIQDLGYEL